MKIKHDTMQVQHRTEVCLQDFSQNLHGGVKDFSQNVASNLDCVKIERIKIQGEGFCIREEDCSSNYECEQERRRFVVLFSTVPTGERATSLPLEIILLPLTPP